MTPTPKKAVLKTVNMDMHVILTSSKVQLMPKRGSLTNFLEGRFSFFFFVNYQLHHFNYVKLIISCKIIFKENLCKLVSI